MAARLGISFAHVFVVLHLDLVDREPPTPQLPQRKLPVLAQLGPSVALHVTVFVIGALVSTQSAHRIDIERTARAAARQDPEFRHIVFLAPQVPLPGGGGGGGGNQQAGPIRRAQGVGSDPITLRVRKPPAPATLTPPSAAAVVDMAPLPSIVLDAKPMASGTFEQIGLPSGGVLESTSSGPGSGGGVGSGSGTGIGSGSGPGLGPGSGGGAGGGAYRLGGAVSAPRLLKEVRPKYTNDALRNKIQGTVVLEAVVTPDGSATQIRVVRSLDRGLDDEAIAALAQWRFEPGRLAGAPVDVLVTILLDFTIR